MSDFLKRLVDKSNWGIDKMRQNGMPLLECLEDVSYGELEEAAVELAALEAVAEAAQRVRKHLPDSVIGDGQRYYQALLSGGEAFDLCRALDALKGAE